MSGSNSRRRDRSVSGSGTIIPGPRNAQPSNTSVASSSTRQEQMRDATIAAEDALRRYQSETQTPAAPFPYQVQRQAAPPTQTLRHASGTVGPLQRIPEVVSEGSSGEAAATPQALRIGGGAGHTVNYGALPRNFDPVTGRKSENKGASRRPSLPYVFEPLSQQPSDAGRKGDFPNPHQSVAKADDSLLSTAQLQRRASQDMQSPLLTRSASSFQQGHSQAQADRGERQPWDTPSRPRVLPQATRDTQPTTPVGLRAPPQRSTVQTLPLAINKNRQTEAHAVAAALAYKTEAASSIWSTSSSESEPTPTASSIAAARERNAQLATQLIPIQLTLPSTFSSSSTLTLGQQQPQLQTIGSRFGAPPVQEQRQTPPMVVSPEEVASIKATAAPFAPTKPSKLSAPPIRSDSNDTSYSGETVALPDGTQVPAIRTDFQNMKRISLPKTAEPSVGGHVLSRADPKVVARNDGSSRTIYSPTPQTLAAARRGTSLQVPQKEEQRIPSPLSASAEAPQAPQIPHALKFRKSVPSIGASETQPSQPANEGKDGGKSTAATTQAKSDDTDVRKRENAELVGFRGDPRRNTFGELEPSMLEEANRKLFVYQMQQLDQDAKVKGVGSSRKPVPSIEKVEKKAESSAPVATSATVPTASSTAEPTSVVRRESSASQRSRRDSIGSATTAFDSPTKEEFPSHVRNATGPSGTTGITKGVPGNRGTARTTVAPPSDVPEMQEPDEAPAARSDEGTEIDDDAEVTYDSSFEKRVPFIIDTFAKDDEGNVTAGDNSAFRFIPISSVKAGKARRPRTRDTRVSFRSNTSQIEQQPRPASRQHHRTTPACKLCFRAGFDCAQNITSGQNTAGRVAFQDFVAAGGLNAFSIRDAVEGSLGGGGSITVEEALGRNYVDKLGEVAFGESALSRPVTRGMYNELLEEKQEQERRRLMYADHKPWSADDGDEIDLVKGARRQRDGGPARRSLSYNNSSKMDRRFSQMTLQDGADHDQIAATATHGVEDDDARQVLLNNIKRSGSTKRPEEGRLLEEGEIVDIDPLDYEDQDDEDVLTSASSEDDDIVVWADRWSAWMKLRQLLAYWVLVFSLQALASGYTNTVSRIVSATSASSSSALLLQLGNAAYNGSQGGGLFFANALVGFGRQRLTLISLVAVGAVCVVAGFVPHVSAILICQSLLGLLSGLVVFLSLATVTDLFATSKGRLFGVASIGLVLLGGQLAGPWISKLILNWLSWSWTYWLTLIVAAVLIVYMGICTRETAAFVLFRREALRLQRTNTGWAPEPQPTTTLRQMFADDLVRPCRLLRCNPMLILLATGLTTLAGMYAFLFAGLQNVFTGSHGLSGTQAALAITVSAAIGLLAGIVGIYLINARQTGSSGFATKARPLYVDEKGYIDTRRPLRVKTESLLVPALIATAVFSFALYTLALTASFATSWLFTAFGIILATASLVVVGVAVVQYVMDGYSPPRKVVLRDVIAREDVSTPTLLQQEDEDRFTSYSRRTAGRIATAAAAGAGRFKGGRAGRHGLRSGHERSEKDDEQDTSREAWLDAGANVTLSRDKRWLDETALATVTLVASLLFTVCTFLSFISFKGYVMLSFGAFSVIFASASLVALLLLLCVYLYGAKPRACSLAMLDEADGERAHARRAAQREKRALQRRKSISASQTTSQQQKQQKRSGPMKLAKRFADALGYKPLSDDGMEVYRRTSSPDLGLTPRKRGFINGTRPSLTPAPMPVMTEADRRSTATDAAEGRRELWLAKYIASRDSARNNVDAERRRLNDAALETPLPAPQVCNLGLKDTLKGWGGVMLGQTAQDVTQKDALGRTLVASTSLPVNLDSTSYFPPHQNALSPPPRAQARASISLFPQQHHRQSSVMPSVDGDGFEIVHLHQQDQQQQQAKRPFTPVMTRKSVDMSRTNIMVKSHSQPLNLYNTNKQQSPRQNFGLGL